MTTNRLGFLLLLLAAVCFALAGCGGGGGSSPDPDPDPDPDPGPGPGDAQFEMSGDWLFVVYHRTASSPDDMDPDDVFVSRVVQSGGSVTVPSPGGGVALTGTVESTVYQLGRSYPKDGGTATETMHLDLQTEDEGAGSAHREWTDGASSASGNAQVLAYRLLPPAQSLDGEWDFVFAPGPSDPAGHENTPDQGKLTISVSGNEVTLVAPDATLQGYVAGSHVWLTRSGPDGTGKMSESIRLFFGDPTNGNGEVYWRWWDASQLITGQDNLDLTRP